MENTTKAELIKSDAFEQALLEGVEYKKSLVTSYKHENKSNYERFYETMLNANEEVKKILDKSRKNRTEAEKETLQKFKSNCHKRYYTVIDMLMPQDVEEGKLTKLEKMAEKIALTIDVIRYMSNPHFANVLDAAFNKFGLSIAPGLAFEDKFPSLASEDMKNNIKDIFNVGTQIRGKVKADNEFINETIFQSKVPAELQFVKNQNPSGLKVGDFRKLVDAKTKIEMTKTDEAKELVEKKIKKIAADKQFEIARAELVRDKLTDI